MIRVGKWPVILAVTFLSVQGMSQKGYFGTPLDTGVLRLSGIYGELRPNHFHAGYDFKTGEKEGMKVLAAADGYVSRINISGGGYGKALYLTHPNGTTTVYAHLQRFSGKIATFVHDKQYEKESFTLEVFPETDQLKVKKGDVIGLSGNTGSSGGPHLHFEIRDNRSSNPVHPYFHGFQMPDQIPPDLNGFRIYPADYKTMINGKMRFFQAPLIRKENSYSLKNNDTVYIAGKFFLGFDATDKMDDTPNIFGLYKAEVFLDNRLFFSFIIDSIGFDETRFINSFVDYASVVKSKDWYQVTRLQPNNRLSIYNNVTDDGIIDFRDDLLHAIRLKIYDVSGNQSVLNFMVKSQPPNLADLSNFPSEGWSENLFRYDMDNEFRSDNVEVWIPENALYDTIHFSYSSSDEVRNAYSRLHKIHYETVPLHQRATLRIKPENLPEKFKKAACMARKKMNGEKVYAGGKWAGEFLEAAISSFGDYFIAVDTIKPSIRAVNLPASKKISGLKQLRFRISDDFSGIATYRATLNGRWILMEYEPKSNLLFYDVGNEVQSGKNNLIIEVKDNCGNTSEFEVILVK